MDQGATVEGRPARSQRRLSEASEPTIKPFTRAQAITDSSIYWLPIWEFPILPAQRVWLREFCRCLARKLEARRGLRQECFLAFKSLYPDLLDTFSETSAEFVPMTGCGIVVGSNPVPRPDFLQIKQQVEESSKKGQAIDTQRWMPDYLHWFLTKKPEQQRDAFFGHGGMLTLFLPPDPKAVPPSLELPRVITSHPAYTSSTEKEIAAMYSLQDSFLQRSKQLFGEPLKGDPHFKGLLFVLPILTARAAAGATGEERAQWFSLFDGYVIESKEDRGLLLLLKDPDFDAELAAILSEMKESGYVYRT